MRAKAYDLVLNGNEVGGGSIRIHDSALQAKVFQLLSLTDEEAQDRFGFFLEALQYGTPPHGGIALGLDRMVMILAGETSLRDVIAFPKTASATDLMSRLALAGARRPGPRAGLCSAIRRSEAPLRVLSSPAATTQMMRCLHVPERGIGDALRHPRREPALPRGRPSRSASRTTAATSWSRGDERGAAMAGQVFEQLADLMKDGYAVASGDVRLAAQLLQPGRRARACATT